MALVLLTLLACGEAPAPAPEAPAAPTSGPTSAAQAKDEALALAKADEAARLLGGTLKARVQEAMGQGGPEGAVSACADEAQGVSAQVRGSTGARVGRASTKLRNPVNAGPDWVKSWLAAQSATAAEAQALSEVVQTDTGAVARVIRPIAVEGVCLICHGDPAAIPPGVQAVLAQRYPTDQATGYKEGDLRGALWAETPVTPSSATP